MLIVEDDLLLPSLMKSCFESEGFTVQYFYTVTTETIIEALSKLVERRGKCVSCEKHHELVRGFKYDGPDRTIYLKNTFSKKKLQDDELPYKLIKTTDCHNLIHI